MHFNPHAPHGGATIDVIRFRDWLKISIHTPRMGARRSIQNGILQIIIFQSTRPAWGRDHVAMFDLSRIEVFQSTRPAWGRDPPRTRCQKVTHADFNPHAPHGGATYLGGGF